MQQSNINRILNEIITRYPNGVYERYNGGYGSRLPKITHQDIKIVLDAAGSSQKLKELLANNVELDKLIRLHTNKLIRQWFVSLQVDNRTRDYLIRQRARREVASQKEQERRRQNIAADRKARKEQAKLERKARQEQIDAERKAKQKVALKEANKAKHKAALLKKMSLTTEQAKILIQLMR